MMIQLDTAKIRAAAREACATKGKRWIRIGDGVVSCKPLRALLATFKAHELARVEVWLDSETRWHAPCGALQVCWLIPRTRYSEPQVGDARLHVWATALEGEQALTPLSPPEPLNPDVLSKMLRKTRERHKRMRATDVARHKARVAAVAERAATSVWPDADSVDALLFDPLAYEVSR